MKAIELSGLKGLKSLKIAGKVVWIP